jgi:hypothetical protein
MHGRGGYCFLKAVARASNFRRIMCGVRHWLLGHLLSLSDLGHCYVLANGPWSNLHAEVSIGA